MMFELIADQFFQYYRYTLELFACMFFFSLSFTHGEKFSFKIKLLFLINILSSIIVSIIAGIIISYSNLLTYSYFSIILYLLLGTLPIIVEFICYKEKIGTKLFVVLSAIVLRNLARTIYQTGFAIVGIAMEKPEIYQRGIQSEIYLLIYYAIFTLLVTLFSYFMNKTRRNKFYNGIDLRILIAFIVDFILNITMSLIENYVRRNYPIGYLLCLISTSLISALIVFIQFLMLYISFKEQESRTIDQNYKDKLNEYELIKESVELINLKCHDLRHQIRAANINGKLDEQFVKEVSDSINIYDCNVNTGNKDLDLLLMDFKFRAQASKIEFELIADGSCISFMERQDVISLFSNILENAIEYEKNMIDQENRFIDLSITEKNGFATISCENPLGKQKQTMKKDSRYHGFGTKSIEHIVKKYEGTYTTTIMDIYYKVLIVIPIP